MKRLVILICGCWLFVSALAQSSTLQIATDKTTSLIFPFPIRHVDRGTKDILVQAIKEPDNLLLVKAASKDFPETNLSVITVDGSVYSFKVAYDAQPEKWIYFMPEISRSTIASYAKGILDNHRTIRGIQDNKLDIHVRVNGIYIMCLYDPRVAGNMKGLQFIFLNSSSFTLFHIPDVEFHEVNVIIN